MTSQTRPDDQPAEQENEGGRSSRPLARLEQDRAVSNERDRVTANVDREVINRVRAAGTESRLARELEKVLFDLGYGTLANLNSKGALFRRLSQMRVYLPPPPLDFKREQKALIYFAVRTAWPGFAKGYIFGEEWDESRASLHTCFVNACLLRFAAEYRRYCAEERPTRGEEPESEDQFEPDARQYYAPRPPPDPQAQVVNSAEIQRLLSIRDMSPQDKIMFIRSAQGWTHAEIGVELGLTESAVSARMHRNRKRIADQKKRDGETDGTTNGS